MDLEAQAAYRIDAQGHYRRLSEIPAYTPGQTITWDTRDRRPWPLVRAARHFSDNRNTYYALGTAAIATALGVPKRKANKPPRDARTPKKSRGLQVAIRDSVTGLPPLPPPGSDFIMPSRRRRPSKKTYRKRKGRRTLKKRNRRVKKKVDMSKRLYGKLSRRVTKVINQMHPVVRGNQTSCQGLNAAVNAARYNQQRVGTDLGSVSMLNELYDYYTATDGNSINLKFQSLRITSLYEDYTVVNPGNAPVTVDIYILQAKSAFGTGHTPYDFVEAAISDLNINPAVVTGARAPIAIVDPDLYLKDIPQFNMAYKQLSHRQITLPSEAVMRFTVKCRPYTLNASTMASAAAAYVANYSKIVQFRVRGALASTSPSGTNLGYAKAGLEWKKTIHFRMNRQTSLFPTIGHPGFADAVGPSAIAPTTYASVNASATISDF